MRDSQAACDDLRPERRFVVYSGTERFPLAHDSAAIGLAGLSEILASG
ncbi:MAG TPA: hypothetical protein VND19_10045 [Acetobacteraceae bacterium]|nr:hypothetical protein [Acetobacteraceae bacterium]